MATVASSRETRATPAQTYSQAPRLPYPDAQPGAGTPHTAQKSASARPLRCGSPWACACEPAVVVKLAQACRH